MAIEALSMWAAEERPRPRGALPCVKNEVSRRDLSVVGVPNPDGLPNVEKELGWRDPGKPAPRQAGASQPSGDARFPQPFSELTGRDEGGT